ncbi:Clp protease N-terminal domain-containing protein [Stackebrandtia soli]|uniref:Clp protease N-terminal domain-containing protein n=1 Tax=Stackebrandtia soli TaxID=1892856 RepID=UPI0039E901CD
MPRFDRDARETVRSARTAAILDNARAVDPERLLYALFERADSHGATLAGDTITVDALRTAFDRANRRGGISDSESELLARMGVDVATLTDHVEREFGEGALDPRAKGRKGSPGFTDDLRRILYGALNEARELRSRRIGDGHLLLSALRQPGIAADVLIELGLSYLEVRARMAA